MKNQLIEAVQKLKEKGITKPQIGIVLGTGLGNLIEEIDIQVEIEYKNIPHFPLSTVETHSGKLIYGDISGKKVLAMQGRFHYYEGYSMKQITFPVRVMKQSGIKYLLLSNAAGSMNPRIRKGSLMLIDDHINLLPDNPLRGSNLDEQGPRFPDMSEPYSPQLNEKLEKIADEENITLHKGVYAAVAGPNLETRAEYRYLRGMGADVVGMSTVPEVIVANHCGLPCAAISVVTDECDPDNLAKVNIEEIIETANKAQAKLTKLFVGLVKQRT
ncbi:MAG: purine-nucleoside phosphorylase [Cytophagales bacterium]|nr:purine-nucleoside phosphorylase [Cytophagales bacterium]